MLNSHRMGALQGPRPDCPFAAPALGRSPMRMACRPTVGSAQGPGAVAAETTDETTKSECQIQSQTAKGVLARPRTWNWVDIWRSGPSFDERENQAPNADQRCPAKGNTMVFAPTAGGQWRSARRDAIRRRPGWHATPSHAAIDARVEHALGRTGIHASRRDNATSPEHAVVIGSNRAEAHRPALVKVKRNHARQRKSGSSLKR